MVISSFKIVLSWLWENRHINLSMEASCLLQCGDPCSASDSLHKITLKKYKNIEDQSKKWTGLDNFESVFTIVDWKLGLTGLFVHDSCYIKLCSPRRLVQAEKHKEKQSQNIASQDKSSFNSTTTMTNKIFSSLPPKHTRIAGIVHSKRKCIWRFKEGGGEGQKTPKP